MQLTHISKSFKENNSYKLKYIVTSSNSTSVSSFFYIFLFIQINLCINIWFRNNVERIYVIIIVINVIFEDIFIDIIIKICIISFSLFIFSTFFICRPIFFLLWLCIIFFFDTNFFFFNIILFLYNILYWPSSWIISNNK